MFVRIVYQHPRQYVERSLLAHPISSPSPLGGNNTFLTDQHTTFQWVRYDNDKLVMSVLYTTQFPPDLNDEADIKLHESRVAKGPEATGLALKGGTVLRYVEFSPGYTVSLDYTSTEAPELSPPSTHV